MGSKIDYANGEGGEAVKKQDKIMGVMPWPEPPVEDSKKD